jgi:nucleoid-associated protein YgaU
MPVNARRSVLALFALLFLACSASEPAPDVTPAPAPASELPSWPTAEIPAAEAAPALPTEHVVARGESLYRISMQYYGAGRYWKEIVRANPGLRPESLLAGQVLVIPALDP